MSIDRDDIRESGGEAPEGWREYGDMLRAYGRQVDAPASLRRFESEAGWDETLRRHRRRQTLRRGVGIPAVMVAVALLGFLVDGMLTDGVRPEETPVVRVAEPPTQAVPEETFAAPEIPPVWIDSHINAVDFPPVGFLDIEMADSLLLIPIADTPVAGE